MQKHGRAPGSPRRPQEGPRGPQEGPRRAPGGPRRAPGGPQKGPRCQLMSFVAISAERSPERHGQERSIMATAEVGKSCAALEGMRAWLLRCLKTSRMDVCDLRDQVVDGEDDLPKVWAYTKGGRRLVLQQRWHDILARSAAPAGLVAESWCQRSSPGARDHGKDRGERCWKEAQAQHHTAGERCCKDA